jgi:hypothetical protein
MGTIPYTSFFRVSVLREKALQLMGDHVTVPISANLTIDWKRFGKMFATATSLTESIIYPDADE